MQHYHISEFFSQPLTLAPRPPTMAQAWNGLPVTNSCHQSLMPPSSHQPYTLIPDAQFAKEYMASLLLRSPMTTGEKRKNKPTITIQDVSCHDEAQECWGRVGCWGDLKSLPRKFDVFHRRSQARGLRKGHWPDHILGSGRSRQHNLNLVDSWQGCVRA